MRNVVMPLLGGVDNLTTGLNFQPNTAQLLPMMMPKKL